MQVSRKRKARGIPSCSISVMRCGGGGLLARTTAMRRRKQISVLCLHGHIQKKKTKSKGSQNFPWTEKLPWHLIWKGTCRFPKQPFPSTPGTKSTENRGCPLGAMAADGLQSILDGWTVWNEMQNLWRHSYEHYIGHTPADENGTFKEITTRTHTPTLTQPSQRSWVPKLLFSGHGIYIESETHRNWKKH